MTTQMISGQSSVYGGQRFHHARRSESSNEPRRGQDVRDGALRTDPRPSSGSFTRAVFEVFASFSTRNATATSDTTAVGSAQPSGGSVVYLKEKLKLDVAVQEDGDVEIALALRAKVKIEGDAGSSADAMQAIQAFATSLFTALRGLFDGAGSKVAPAQTGTTQPGTATSTTQPSASSAPAVAQVASSTPPAATQETVDSSSATETSSGDTSAAPVAPANVRWIGSYLSVESRLRILAQHAEVLQQRDERAADEEKDEALGPLREQFDAIAQQLRAGQDTGLPSLADFLRALADTTEDTQRTSFAFSLSVRGSFVSTSA
jgi:hypothetical protein